MVRTAQREVDSARVYGTYWHRQIDKLQINCSMQCKILIDNKNNGGVTCTINKLNELSQKLFMIREIGRCIG